MQRLLTVCVRVRGGAASLSRCLSLSDPNSLSLSVFLLLILSQCLFFSPKPSPLSPGPCVRVSLLFRAWGAQMFALLENWLSDERQRAIDDRRANEAVHQQVRVSRLSLGRARRRRAPAPAPAQEDVCVRARERGLGSLRTDDSPHVARPARRPRPTPSPALCTRPASTGRRASTRPLCAAPWPPQRRRRPRSLVCSKPVPPLWLVTAARVYAPLPPGAVEGEQGREVSVPGAYICRWRYAL